MKKRDLSTNTVVVRISSSPDGLNPVNGNSSVHSFILSYTQKKLIATNLVSEESEPVLITSLPNADSSGLLYHYELKNDVYWDDQSKLSVQDIIFTCKIVMCPLTNNPDIRPIYTSIIDSVFPDKENPNGFFLKAKTKHVLNKEIFLESIYIQQKTHWDKEGITDKLTFKNIHSEKFTSNQYLDAWFNEFNNSNNAYLPSKMVGLGPYLVQDFQKDNYITLTRKKEWWGDKKIGKQFDNHPDKIIFKVIKDDASVYLGLKNEEIDFTLGVGGASKLRKLQKLDYFKENYKSRYISRYSYSYLGLNMKPDLDKQKPFFTDVNVRKAIALLVPVQEIIDVMFYGEADRQISITSPLKSSCNTSLKPVILDVDKAKLLLKEAGWIDTDNNQILDKIINGKKEQFSFKLNYPAGGSGKEVVFMIKESMKKAGVNLVANPLDFNSLYQKASNHQFDAMLAGWLGDSKYSDPTQLWSTKSWSNKGSNFCGFGTAYSDSLIVQANTALDKTAHLRAYKELQKLIYDEQPYVFLWSSRTPVAAHKRFSNTEFFRAKPNVSLGSFKLKDNL